MEQAHRFFNELNHSYNDVHRTKENLFWATYMATSDDHDGFARAEKAYKDFISDRAKLNDVKPRDSSMSCSDCAMR